MKCERRLESVLKKSDEPMNQASDLPDESYVYDFLYYDSRRIGSFQAQLNPHGSLTALKSRTGTGEEDLSGSLKKATVGINGLGGGETGVNDAHKLSWSEDVERNFDPYWINGLSLYEKAEQNGLLKLDITQARVGQLVVVRGGVTVLDYSILRHAWQSGVLKDMAMTKPTVLPPNSTGAERRAHKLQEEEAEKTFQFSVDIVKALPHTVQATIHSAGQYVWCTLRDEAMVGSASDIMLKHGFSLEGDWTIFGILDAHPDDAANDTSLNSIFTVMAATGGSPFGQMIATLAPIARNLLGRPNTAYAVTPIMIFREISGT